MTPSTIAANSTRRARRRRWTVLAVVLHALVTLFVAVDSAGRLLVDADDPGEPVAGVTEVSVRDNDFAPDAIEVPVGTTVTWHWEGDDPHNVVGDDFESPVQEDGRFTYTFSAPGTHDYRCTLHPSMRGEVVVTGESSS